MWIQIEFLIFMMQLFTIPIFLLVTYYAQWLNDGLKFVMGSGRPCTDGLEKNITYVNYFQNYVINLAVGVFLVA